MLKKIFSCILSASMIIGAFVGCEKKELKMNKDEKAYYNFTAPEEGEEIVVLTIKDYGEVKIKLFEDLSAKGSKNFLELSRQGYYDGLTFHRIIENFMIQGGDPLGTGVGGESIWGGKFDGGIADGLYHFTGAVAYANSRSTSTNGSQFYIVTGEKVTDEELDYINSEEYAQNFNYTIPTFSEEVREKYKEVGGTPFLDGGYTIFGQVIDGLDIVYEISKTETGANDKPLTPVVIEKAEVVPYDGSEINWYIE